MLQFIAVEHNLKQFVRLCMYVSVRRRVSSVAYCMLVRYEKCGSSDISIISNRPGSYMPKRMTYSMRNAFHSILS